MDLNGKRLLFLGGPIQVIKAVEQAKKMGVYTIVTDIKDNALAKQTADESLSFSVLDTDGIINWCRKNPVDGVLNFGVDPAQKTNVVICEALGLPHFATLEQVEYLSNKQAFKALCRECGVDVIKSYTEADITDGFDEYPILVKPAQSCGSRGNSICRNKQEADEAISYARENSLNGEVIIERYMQGHPDFAIEYYVHNGHAYLVRTVDRYTGMREYKLDRQAVGAVSPSKYTEMFVQNVNQRVVKMLEHIGVANGPVFMQGFVDGDTVRFYDPAYRFPGSAYEKLLLAATGVNLIEYAIRFALGSNQGITPELYDDAFRLQGKCVLDLFFTARPGVIASISGMEEIKKMPEVVFAVIKEAAGSTIPASGDVRQRIAEVALIVEDDKKTIEEAVLKIHSMFKVLDENGENMLVSLADSRSFR